MLGATQERAESELKESLLFEIQLANVSFPVALRLRELRSGERAQGGGGSDDGCSSGRSYRYLRCDGGRLSPAAVAGWQAD